MSSPTEPDGPARAGADAPAHDLNADDGQGAVPNQAVRSGAREGSRRRGRLGLLLLGVVLVSVVGAAGYFYFAKLHHEASAHRHVPSDATVAMRADAAEIVLFKPVRDHLWPLLLDRRGEPTAPSKEAEKRRLEHIAKLTGVAIPEDLREVVVASVDPTSWVVLVGGTFRRGRFVDGVEQLLHEENIGGWTRDGELLVHRLGPAVGQADDGTLVVGTNRAIAQAALPTVDSEVAVPLPVEGAVSFLVNHQAWSGAVSMLPLSLPGIDTLSRIEEAHGSFVLSETPRVRVTLVPKSDADTERLRRDLERLISTARTFILLAPGDLGGAKDALRSAAVESVNGAVELSAPWPYEALDRAVRRLADQLSGKPPPEPAPERSWLPF